MRVIICERLYSGYLGRLQKPSGRSSSFGEGPLYGPERQKDDLKWDLKFKATSFHQRTRGW